jgi:hypothetical protein
LLVKWLLVLVAGSEPALVSSQAACNRLMNL